MKVDEFALELSHKLHVGTFRKDGKTPYTVHTDYVGNNSVRFYRGLVSAGDINPFCRAVGFSHDGLEDTELTASELLRLGIGAGFNSDSFELCVVRPVVILTRPNKSYSIMSYLANIKSNLIATAVKLADLEHNLSDLGYGNLRDKYELCQQYLRS
jgi:hypothetical protein